MKRLTINWEVTHKPEKQQSLRGNNKGASVYTDFKTFNPTTMHGIKRSLRKNVLPSKNRRPSFSYLTLPFKTKYYNAIHYSLPSARSI